MTSKYICNHCSEEFANNRTARAHHPIRRYVKDSSLCKVVGREGGGEIVTRRMSQLKGGAGHVMRTDNFWSLVGREGGEEIVTRWMTRVRRTANLQPSSWKTFAIGTKLVSLAGRGKGSSAMRCAAPRCGDFPQNLVIAP